MKKRNGFTIVELVIVIAVIAVLAAVLIPTFRGITDKAEESTALADSKVSYEEYLTKTLPENISKDLYIRVKNGYVHYIDGKAVKTNDSYVTTINEYVEWIDRNGDYRPPFYIEIDALGQLFVDECNIVRAESGKTYTLYTKIENYMTPSSNWDKSWRRFDLVWNDDFFNKWSWMFEYFLYLAKEQDYATLNVYLEEILNKENISGFALQNIAVFFLKINGKKWNESYAEENGSLSSIWTTLDFTEITFGDYAPFIPYDQFTDNINYAKEIYLGNNNEHQ